MTAEFFAAPILNSPYALPTRHWELDETGQPTRQIASGRRKASFVTPIPKARKQTLAQTSLVLDEGQARVTVHNVQDRPGLSAELFEAVAHSGVSVDMIVQNVSRNSTTEVSFTVDAGDLNKGLGVIEKLLQRWPGSSVSHEREIALLTVNGIGLRTHTGVGERMFRALADSQINVKMVNTSEIRMSVVVARNQGAAALESLQLAFGLK